MAKIQQFKNKPTPYSYGQYYYDNDDMDTFQPIEESDSVLKPIDKYSDRKSTRLNSSHGYISYAVFCLKKKKKHNHKD